MTRLEMVNIALTALGTKNIRSLNSNDSEEARVMNLLFSPTVEEVLSLYPWPSAMRRVELTGITEGAALTKWDYAYRIPANCVWIVNLLDPDDFSELELVKGSSRPSPTEIPLYEREGSVLFCDLDTCYVKYIHRPEDMEELRDVIGEAIAYRLAQKSSTQIGRDLKISQLLEQRFETALLRAKIAENADHLGEAAQVQSWGDNR